MRTSFEEFDGPRLVRREELYACDQLARICFDMPAVDNEEQLLANYVPPARGGWYVMFHDGKPVSQIGVAHDELKMYDARVRTGSIGGVCTHPEYRNQGLASHILEYCTQQMVKEGARLMLISGDAGVYMRLGNVFHGRFMYFSPKSEQARQHSSTPDDLHVRRATPADALLCSQLYQAEPVHFFRKKADFMPALDDQVRNNYISTDAWIVERAGQALAYLFLGVPWTLSPDLGIRHVGEYAGDRSALVEAIHVIMTTTDLKDVSWPVAWQDIELIQCLENSGYTGNMTNLDGHTLRIVDFPNFMKDLRPILEARLDTKLLRGLRFEQSGPLLSGIGDDRYAIVRGPECLELNGTAMTQLIMGNAHTQETIHAPGALDEVISALFPLPSFLPGLNYH